MNVCIYIYVNVYVYQFQIYTYYMSKQNTYCNPNVVLLCLGVWLHKTFISDRGRPYTDTPCVMAPGVQKLSQPIADYPDMCIT